MGLARKATIFAVAWFFIYVTVYFVFIAPSFLPKSTKYTAELQISPPKITKQQSIKEIITLTDPFIPDACPDTDVTVVNVGVIVVCHDESPSSIIQTVKSILENSGALSPQIVIVDDHSTVHVRDWSEWGRMDKNVVVVRTSRHIGISESRNAGLKTLAGKTDVVVFLDPGAIVSKDWLSPLLDTLQRHPRAVVYPVIDILEDQSGTVLQAGNVLATLDWSMKLKWEDLDSVGGVINDRYPLLPAHPSASDELISPAAPTVFAVNSKFLDDIGGLPTSSLLSAWGPDNIELSLRVWLCTDALIIRQPCSRVAVRRCMIRSELPDGSLGEHLGICPDSGTLMGYTQFEGDRDAMSIAELWLGKDYRRLVWQQRMLKRFPYEVTPRDDVRHPDYISKAPGIDVNKCNDFSWYLQKVYPGLSADRIVVKEQFEKSDTPDNMKRMLLPLIEQYRKSSPLLRAEESDSRKLVKAPRVVPTALELQMEEAAKKEEKLKEKIRDEQLCMNVDDSKCEDARVKGECTSNLAKTLFGCPKACGFCSDDNKLCTDFFLGKCPKYASEGQCTDPESKEWMEINCRRSCKFCRRPDDPPINNVNSKEKNSDANSVDSVADKPSKEDEASELLKNAVRINPYTAQELWESSKLEDDIGSEPCALANTNHAKLLDYIHVHPAPKGGHFGEGSVADRTTSLGNRIFCATYTMESKHASNVATLRNTWGKRCDGWVAFSTVTDPTIPAIQIHHEGPESYNNMWQKSRSIWKYIAQHYMDEFDWFLIGGDDMYYIIENLREYLRSPEVVSAKNENKGMFIGRRFFPPNQIAFNSGGAGYILDKVSLQHLAEHIDGPPCFPHQQGFWEDVNVANCLLQTHHITPFDTRDKNGRERFHPFQPANHLLYTVPKNPDWYKKYNPDLKLGLECCAADSVSFHYSPGPFMKKLHNYMYHCGLKRDLPH